MSIMQLITKESVEMSLISDISKRNFHSLIEVAQKAVISKDTIRQDYDVFKMLMEISDYLDKRLKSENKPDKDRIDTRNEAYKTYLGPLNALFEKFEPEFYKVNAEIQAEERAARDKIRAQNAIMLRHQEFVRDTVRGIIIATDNKELGKIQMAVGTEKSRKSFYGDHHSKLEQTCDILLELIDGRKDMIKKNAKLMKDKEKAKLGGDIALETQLAEEIELSERAYKENAETIAEKAYSEISALVIVGDEIESVAVTPRTHRWSTRIDDAEFLYQKHPELFVLEPNKKAIKEFLDSRKDELDKEKEHDFNGLVLYYKPFYL